MSLFVLLIAAGASLAFAGYATGRLREARIWFEAARGLDLDARTYLLNAYRAESRGGR